MGNGISAIYPGDIYHCVYEDDDQDTASSCLPGHHLAQMTRTAHRHSRPSRVEPFGRASTANPRNTPLETIQGHQGVSLVRNLFGAINPTDKMLRCSRESEKVKAVKQKVYKDSVYNQPSQIKRPGYMAAITPVIRAMRLPKRSFARK